MSYGCQPPTEAILTAMRFDVEYQANRIADATSGAGKVKRVRVEVAFGDGSIVAYETERTPTT